VRRYDDVKRNIEQQKLSDPIQLIVFIQINPKAFHGILLKLTGQSKKDSVLARCKIVCSRVRPSLTRVLIRVVWSKIDISSLKYEKLARWLMHIAI
jgi:hypothetical protein